MTTPTRSADDLLEQVFNIHHSPAMEDNWDKSLAQQRANDAGIALTRDHWEVIETLRLTYQRYTDNLHTRQLTTALQRRFADRGGLKYLYALFPGGPVGQGCYLAGLVPPKDSVNPSFGSVV
ncbi:MAG: TusE/DsrC/DsvC family sulfur relay protein [Gammaproteobacteria bacterium]|nr:TusE/DsrC/DsvC family sulfur relay protein [Gammaproteobacteria bacterium]